MARFHKREKNGVEVFQITDDPNHEVSNIYCERPFVSADGSRFLYARQVGTGTPGLFDDWEYILCTFDQRSHPHAALTPDFRRVIFNSDRSGRPQLYVAKLPDAFLEPLKGSQ